MSAFRWYRTTTCPTRYVGDSRSERKNCDASSDVFELVKEHAASRQKKSLLILDVGCSTGVAAAYMRGRLLDAGLEAGISGVDPAPEVFEHARRNLDKFYEGRMEDAVIEDHYDIVLCARLLRFALPNEQKRLIEACADRCVPDGALITDGVLKTMKNEYHTVSKSRAADYALSLLQSWDSLGRWERLRLKTGLRGKRFAKMVWYRVKCRLGRALRRTPRPRPGAGCSRMPDGAAGAGRQPAPASGRAAEGGSGTGAAGARARRARAAAPRGGLIRGGAGRGGGP